MDLRHNFFLAYGRKIRFNAMCPKCFSLERHRVLYLYMKQRTNNFKQNVKILHIAPEKCFSEVFKRKKSIEYISADLNPHMRKVMIKMDIQDIKLPDNTFDVILCSHVLEHVPDDRKAMQELYRVLKPDGWAIIQVPIDKRLKKTFEDDSINTEKLRKKYYGQEDHLRLYGMDYIKRLQEAGFKMKIENAKKVIKEYNSSKYILPETYDIYLCTKS